MKDVSNQSLDIESLLTRDPYLSPHKNEIERRYNNFKDLVVQMEEKEGGLESFALGHKTFGPHIQSDVQ